MFKKILAGIITMVIVVATAAGFTTSNLSSSKKNAEKTKITYMAFSATPDHGKDIKAMIAAFENKNPDIKVDYQPVGFTDYFTRLQTLVASGTAPDTFELNYENFVTYAAKGALLDLAGPISQDKSFNPAVFSKNAYDVFKYNGKQYGLVSSFSDVVLYYNKDLFDKAKVKYPDASWTWKEELAAAEKLTDAKKGIWGTYSPIQFWEFYKTIAQNGGSIFNKDKTQVTINSKKNVETLQWMIDKVNKYKVTPTDKQLGGRANEEVFKAGKIAMLRSGIWLFSSFKDAKFKWDIALEPGNTNKAHAFFANGVVLSKDTKNAEAAWKWIKFYTSSAESAKIRVASSWDLPALVDKSLVQGYLKQTPPASRQVVFDALKTLVVPPVIERWNELTDSVGKELDLARLGKKSAQKALDDAKISVEKLIK